MTSLSAPCGPVFRGTPFVVAFAAVALSGCYDDDDYHYDADYYGIPCDPGVTTGTVDTDAILELEPGLGVGATVEYAGDGGWRFAVACDSLLTGYLCDWRVAVSSIDGTIESFEPEGLEDGDLIDFSDEGVLFNSYTDVGVDAFTVLATPGAGMRVSASIDGNCAGPYLFWADGSAARSAPTPTADLFPRPAGS